ncbi:helix-turn-helix domain-containing protein [Hymenobacter properus]|uniref:AraC family transcriptional regulator n=1 Tax=Hymenobacter properus TaxID=2791026 RepID=A0A931BJJ4_9BACT|nr:helix-turn-helix domain-containing protein [Hymenobacter properus]MBF9140650.1 AraC family transcriptional regulator [Hymenobacter properus]MBR7719458.1 AraC family transcriptional regulator [Microvirga sp. SRT04]
MPYQPFDVPEPLRFAIKGFWHNSIEFAELPAGFEVLPDGYAEIIFHFGSACSIATPDGLRPLPSPFLMGLLGQPVTLHGAGRVEVIGIKCFPWAVFELLGLPAAGPGGVRHLEHSIAQLHAPLAACLQAGQVAEALVLAARYFEQLPLPAAADNVLAKAGKALRAAKGTLPVREVAAAAHATVRTLERKFKESSGHTVKDVSGLIRFEQVRNQLWLRPETSLAGLAHELGYADQAHMSRDFRRYSGTTPAAFARHARHLRLAATPDFVAFLQA